MFNKNTPLTILEEKGSCKNCKQCDPRTEGICCQSGSGFCVDDDLPRIAAFLNVDQESLKGDFLEPVNMYGRVMWKPKTRKDTKGEKKVFGPCVFFKKGAGCTIHPVKPLQCRVSNWGEESEELTRWFLENHCVNPNDPMSYAQWRITEEVRGAKKEIM